MQRKFKGILLHTKASRENDLFIKLLTDSDEIISGIVYGGLSKKKKSQVAKKARAGDDIGKKGKGFAKVAKAAGGGEKGQKIAAAAMWKNVKR